MKKNGDKPEILLESERIVNEHAKKLFNVKKSDNSVSKLPLYMLLSGAGMLGAGIFIISRLI